MANKVNQVADELVTVLNAGVASISASAVRKHPPRYDIAAGDLDSLKVTVIPAARSAEVVSRSAYSRGYTCAILIQKKLSADRSETEIAALDDIVEDVFAYLLANPRLTTSGTRLMAWNNDPIYSTEHLHEEGIYTSVIQVTAMDWR